MSPSSSLTYGHFSSVHRNRHRTSIALGQASRRGEMDQISLSCARMIARSDLKNRRARLRMLKFATAAGMMAHLPLWLCCRMLESQNLSDLILAWVSFDGGEVELSKLPTITRWLLVFWRDS